jgi:tRNA threonylcarbamoyladenosine biosynthesis protein TsaE
MIHTSYSVEETRQLAKEILRRLGRKHVVLLSGELGAGKTVIAQIIAEELGIKEQIISPTYVLMKVYPLPEGSMYNRFVHVDLYRIEYDQRLDELGLVEYLEDPQSLVVVEWPERIIGTWPTDACQIRLDYGDKSTIRTIDF